MSTRMKDLESRLAAEQDRLCQLQCSIAALVRGSTHGEMQSAQQLIRNAAEAPPPRTLGRVVCLAALAAAVHDDVIWAALANVRQEIVLRRADADEQKRMRIREGNRR